MWIDKLKSEFHLGLVVVFCVVTVLGITPFAVYRFASGQSLLGAADLAIVACISIGAWYSVHTGRSEGAAFFAAITYSIGAIVVSYLDGFSGLLWVFPVLVANFLLVQGWRAIAISAVVIFAVGLCESSLEIAAHLTTYIITTTVVSLFAFIFAWRSEHQRRQLEAIALHDPLTGVGNRRGMQSELEIAMATSARTGMTHGLIVFDLDHFKQINDSFGHEAGDQVLIQVSQLVLRHTRKDDRFFRVGGEEFALLVRGTNAASLGGVAEKLRCAIESEIRCNGRVVTISMGVTRYCIGEAAVVWQSRADAAMYRAKHNGRNCWVLDDTCEDPRELPKPSSVATAPPGGLTGDEVQAPLKHTFFKR